MRASGTGATGFWLPGFGSIGGSLMKRPLLPHETRQITGPMVQPRQTGAPAVARSLLPHEQRQVAGRGMSASPMPAPLGALRSGAPGGSRALLPHELRQSGVVPAPVVGARQNTNAAQPMLRRGLSSVTRRLEEARAALTRLPVRPVGGWGGAGAGGPGRGTGVRAVRTMDARRREAEERVRTILGDDARLGPGSLMLAPELSTGGESVALDTSLMAEGMAHPRGDPRTTGDDEATGASYAVEAHGIMVPTRFGRHTRRNLLVHERAHAFALAAHGVTSDAMVDVDTLMMTEFQAHTRQAIDFVSTLGTPEEAYTEEGLSSHRAHLARMFTDPVGEIGRRMTGPYAAQVAGKMVSHEGADPRELFADPDTRTRLTPEGQRQVERRVAKFTESIGGFGGREAVE